MSAKIASRICRGLGRLHATELGIQPGDFDLERARFPVVVHVMFVRPANRGRELCLLRRANTGFMDGWFTLPGGHQEHGESLLQAAIRECIEEVDVIPIQLEPVAALTYRSAGHQGLNFVFRCNHWQGEIRLAEPVFDQLLWAQEETLPQLHAPWIGDVLALEHSGGWLKELHYG